MFQKVDSGNIEYGELYCGGSPATRHPVTLHCVVSQVPASKGDAERAIKTLPPGLEVRQSSVPKAGLGVFATKHFASRTRFGPYKGRRVNNSVWAQKSGYCWEVRILQSVIHKIIIILCVKCTFHIVQN